MKDLVRINFNNQFYTNRAPLDNELERDEPERQGALKGIATTEH